jgi:hypothetical protein
MPKEISHDFFKRNSSGQQVLRPNILENYNVDAEQSHIHGLAVTLLCILAIA